jgi:predicted DNA binding CopG/RHH family protein
MVGRSKDPKGTRITVRLSDADLGKLQAEASKRSCTVGAVVRSLIREFVPQPSSTK